MRETIYVLDFGSQYAHLIVRRIRDLGVYAELVPYRTPASTLSEARGIILSGGPHNISGSAAMAVDPAIFQLKKPVLGICYGLQLMAHRFHGTVKRGTKREYGPTKITITKTGELFRGLRPTQMTWMSHGDYVARLPKGFVRLASSDNCQNAAVANLKNKMYGLQFHPEVSHTTNGNRMLANFVRITGAQKTWDMKQFVQKKIASIGQLVGSDRVVCALSGGVDSSVAATLVHRAIGAQLTCIFVDTGLLREGEAAQVKKTFQSYQKLNLKVIYAQREFLAALKGVIDPEQKRKIIGRLFIRIFEREAKKLGTNVQWLVQGTLYTDAITSGVSVGKSAAVIKSHHNVGGLPKKLGFKLIEPFRELYKDEVRRVGRVLGLPTSVVERQPFPGPGLAVRIIGEITETKLRILRQADTIVREEIGRVHAKHLPQQYFAVLPTIKSVGVQGDARTYGYPIIVRAVATVDFMTADWSRLPYPLLARIATRITNEVHQVNRVLYDITSKPPGTVEWE